MIEDLECIIKELIDERMEQVARIVSDFTDVPVSKILTIDSIIVKEKGSRKREYVIPRHLAIYFSYNNIEFTTLEGVGVFFNRHHSSVIHAIQTVQSDLSSVGNNQYKTLFNNILIEINKHNLNK